MNKGTWGLGCGRVDALPVCHRWRLGDPPQPCIAVTALFPDLLTLSAHSAPLACPWNTLSCLLGLSVWPFVNATPAGPGLETRVSNAYSAGDSGRAGLPEAGLTCGVGRLEALPLDRVVRVEAQEHPAARGQDGLRLLAAAETAKDRGFGITSVEHFQVVISTLRLRLNVHLQEGLGGTRQECRLRMWPGAAGAGNGWLQTQASGPQLMHTHRSGQGWGMLLREDQETG